MEKTGVTQELYETRLDGCKIEYTVIKENSVTTCVSAKFTANNGTYLGNANLSRKNFNCNMMNVAAAKQIECVQTFIIEAKDLICDEDCTIKDDAV